MRTVIIGGGSAGVAAAVHLRRKDENAEITIIEKSDEFAVAACGLPYMLAGKIQSKDELIGASTAEMHAIFNIDVRLQTEVLNINAEQKSLSLSGGEKLNYDKLIIAAGALQLRPDIPGILADNIFTLHNLHSAQKIIDYFHGLNAKNVIILGGGIIGLRTAEALFDNGARITLIENGAHILSDADYDFAQLVQQKLKRPKFNIITNTSIKEFLPDRAVLGNGTKIKYDMAVIAAGSKSENRLPIMTGIDLGETGGISVNTYMQTSKPDIFACGDNAETTSLIDHAALRINDASPVLRSAKTAADNAAGIMTRMNGILENRIVKVFDYVIGKTGCNEDELKRADIPYHRLYLATGNGENYLPTSEKLYMKLLFGINGKILGLQIMGKTGVFSRLNTVAALIFKGATVQDMADMPAAYFPEFSRAKDALNILGTLAVDICFGSLKTADADKLSGSEILLNVCPPQRFRPAPDKPALNIPLSALRENLSLLPRNKKIIVCGNGGYDAYLAYCILTQRGFGRVFLLNSPDSWRETEN